MPLKASNFILKSHKPPSSFYANNWSFIPFHSEDCGQFLENFYIIKKMGSVERSKKKAQLWKKVMLHFSLCFAMGFLTGLAPTGKSFFSSKVGASNRTTQFAPQPSTQVSHLTTNVNKSWIAPRVSRQTTTTTTTTTKIDAKPLPQLKPRRLVIIVTPTSTKLPFQTVFLRRLANTIKLAPQPLMWIVVEAKTESTELPEILRKTGIMYRHVVFSKDFTDLEAELNHQRNLALKHIEHHRLNGIVHFAELSNVYDLQFFHQFREIEVFGTWPVALLAANRKKVIIEGHVCDSSHVIGWHLRNMNNETEALTPPIHISSFAFNSSILWDPERWGRTSSVQDTSQNSIKFVKQVILEDDSKLKGIRSEDCSKIILWRFNFRAHISNH